MRPKDKVAIVTGGACGTGAAAVRRFVEEGAQEKLPLPSETLSRWPLDPSKFLGHARCSGRYPVSCERVESIPKAGR